MGLRNRGLKVGDLIYKGAFTALHGVLEADVRAGVRGATAFWPGTGW